ncbi:hypothetical protein ACHAW6_001422, partial [Cyclotella cf. meneghiniana]
HFLDGCTKELAANTIDEALYAQCNTDGNQYIMLDDNMDYRKNPDVAISQNDQVKIVNGKKLSRAPQEVGSCVKLSDLKESHPLQVAESKLAAGIIDEPAFNWWVTWVFKKKDRLSPWLSPKALDMTSGPTSLGLSSPKMWMRLT